MGLSQEQVKLIAEAVAEELREGTRCVWVEPDTHNEHHAFITGLISRQKEWAKLREKIINASVMTVIPIMVLWFLGMVGKDIIEQLKILLR